MLYNLFEQSSYLKKKKNGVGDEKRERETLISSAIMEIKGTTALVGTGIPSPPLALFIVMSCLLSLVLLISDLSESVMSDPTPVCICVGRSSI